MRLYEGQRVGRWPGANSLPHRVNQQARVQPCSKSLRPGLPLQCAQSHTRSRAVVITFNKDSPFKLQPSRRARGSPLHSVPPENDNPGETAKEEDKARESPAQLLRSKSGKADDPDGQFTIDSINPYSMGRKSRQILDNVWTQFTKLSSPVRGAEFGDDFYQRLGRDVGEFDTPQAAFTRVLVAGATGRVGRVLVRKLLLRGYSVVALVRPRDSEAVSSLDDLPKSVDLVYGDVTDYAACSKAVEGCEKVVFCATSRSTTPADIRQVEEKGIRNLSRAFHDYRNKARIQRQGGTAGATPSAKITVAEGPQFEDMWAIEHVGVEAPPPAEPEPEAVEAAGGFTSRSKAARRFMPKNYVPRAKAPEDTATATVNERKNLVFEGEVKSEKGYAQVGTQLGQLREGLLADCEGLLVRVLGDGQAYIVQLKTENEEVYSTRITAGQGYSNLRLPFNTFRPLTPGAPLQLNPATVSHLSIRFDPPSRAPAVIGFGDSDEARTQGKRFKLEIDRIKALPGGEEPDFILVSCAGKGGTEDAIAREARISIKRAGELTLRNSGLGYTIVRPGPLLEEPGGYKALIFDQKNRIKQGISCADVADICLKALHNVEARNKTFEVCYEYTPEDGLEMYELVAHAPDKANNYLGPALAALEKNT